MCKNRALPKLYVNAAKDATDEPRLAEYRKRSNIVFVGILLSSFGFLTHACAYDPALKHVQQDGYRAFDASDAPQLLKDLGPTIPNPEDAQNRDIIAIREWPGDLFSVVLLNTITKGRNSFQVSSQRRPQCLEGVKQLYASYQTPDEKFSEKVNNWLKERVQRDLPTAHGPYAFEMRNNTDES